MIIVVVAFRAKDNEIVGKLKSREVGKTESPEAFAGLDFLRFFSNALQIPISQLPLPDFPTFGLSDFPTFGLPDFRTLGLSDFPS